MKQEITVEAVVENLEKVTAFVDECLESAGCPMRLQMQMDIAVDELFSNIAYYAYQPGTGMATVQVEVKEEPACVVITFLDRGIPYDPLSREEPDTSLSAEERKVGGLGIYMVKKSMDQVSYRYSEGQNILEIRKDIK